jgi:hypothetical protein
MKNIKSPLAGKGARAQMRRVEEREQLEEVAALPALQQPVAQRRAHLLGPRRRRLHSILLVLVGVGGGGCEIVFPCWAPPTP